MQPNIKLVEINEFIRTTHQLNLERLRTRLVLGKWHWMFPDHWQDNDANKNVLFHAINAALLPKPKMFGEAR